MDFNILKIGAAKSLELPCTTLEDEAILGHKLMNVAAQHRPLLDSMNKAGAIYEDLERRHKKLADEKAIVENALVELMLSDKLSGIVKAKNKEVISSHDIKINYINKTVTYI